MAHSRGGQRLLDLAARLGFTVIRKTRGGRHVLLVHKSTKVTVCVPLNVSETGRNFDNYRTELQRGATAGADPDRPAPGRQLARPTGEAVERAERIAERTAEAQRLRDCRAIERHDRHVGFYSRLMRR